MLKISIPFVDLRGKTPIDLLRAYPDRAHSVIRAARRTYGLRSQLASFLALPLADKRSHRWLKRTNNPYLYEIETFADIVRAKGMYTLNLNYEWSCTTGAYRTQDGVTMLRVLDCPIPTLGKQAMVVLQQGRAGDYYNITWPGLSGVYTAMAPGRFTAAINKAPMRRHNRGYAGDWLKNRKMARGQISLPPAHLLRQVMEFAPTYEAAKQMLSNMPLAMPAIFTLSGINPGEGCVIERLEDRAETVELGGGQRVCSSNHFSSAFAGEGTGWRPREPDSYGRLKSAMLFYGHELEADNFEWLQAPVINPYTRICIITNAATQRLMVQGYEGMGRATELFNMPAVDNYAQRRA
jgi:hypothetical protein